MNRSAGSLLKSILVNKYEVTADRLLGSAATRAGDRLLPKVRVADAISLDQLPDLAADMYRFGLYSHFDFVMADCATTQPKFVVELDGKQHLSDTRQQQRDHMKDQLCILAELPILRVANDFVYNNGRWPLLSYAVDTFYRAEAFLAAQEAGTIPLDERYHHGSFGISMEDGQLTWNTYDGIAVNKLWQLHEGNLIPEALPNVFVTDSPKTRSIEALAYLPVAMNRYLLSETRVRDFNFTGISASDLAEEIAIAEICDLAIRWTEGKAVAIDSRTMQRKATLVQNLIDDGLLMRSVGGSSHIEGSEPFGIAIRLGRS